MKAVNVFLFFSLMTFSVYSQPTIEELNKEAEEIFNRYKEKANTLLNNNEVEITYDVAYKKLMELHIEKHSSESFIKAEKLREEFINKMNLSNEEHKEIIGTPKPTFEWTLENIDSTLFANVEEATDLYKLSLIESNKEYIANEEYYVYMNMALQKFGAEIVAKVIVDYELYNPNSAVNKALGNIFEE